LLQLLLLIHAELSVRLFFTLITKNR